MPRALVERIPFPSLYNEDWILFLEAGAYGFGSIRLSEKLLEQRTTRRRFELGALIREAMGEITFRTLLGAPRGSALLEWIATHPRNWEVERQRYSAEVAELEVVAGERGMTEAGVLSRLLRWLAEADMEEVRYGDHEVARSLWSGRFTGLTKAR